MFTGKERDAESGLDYFRARYFSSAQGRLTTPDELLVDQWEESPQSWNLYVYGRNNPIRFIDPTGRGCRISGSSYTDNSDSGPDCTSVLAGNHGAQQVTVTGQRGNGLTAFAINAGFALSNTANDYWMFTERLNVLQNTPTNREFTGRAPERSGLREAHPEGLALMAPGRCEIVVDRERGDL